MTDLIQLANDNTAKTFKFNHDEAQIARDWQEKMSNTAHQRQVADLKAAGLNPVLSANSGATAYSTSSASGSADSSGVSGLSNILSSAISANAMVKSAEISADAAKYGADHSLPGMLAQLLSGEIESNDGSLLGVIGGFANGIGASGSWMSKFITASDKERLEMLSNPNPSPYARFILNQGARSLASRSLGSLHLIKTNSNYANVPWDKLSVSDRNKFKAAARKDGHSYKTDDKYALLYQRLSTVDESRIKSYTKKYGK